MTTKRTAVDGQSGMSEIKQSFVQTLVEKYDLHNDRWVPDNLELSLYCGDELVGACRFDVTSYVDAGGKTEKVIMVAPGEEPSNKAQLYMKGDSENHGDAFLIFRIFVDSLE